MPLVFITGISTSGKSAVAKELSKRGWEAYDTEHDGISAWFDKSTGQPAAEFGEMPERTPKWLKEHEWLISPDWLRKVASQAKHKLIFICGGSANEAEVRALCQKTFWLKTDEVTIRQRVAIPRDHDYGTKPHELKIIIKNNKKNEAEYSAFGATIIDARQSLSKVIDDILENLKA